MSELAWHYTTGENFISIVESNVLLPAVIRLKEEQAPVLWFSQNQVWEPTACKGISKDGIIHTGTRHETREYGGGLVRFGYPKDRLLSWKKLRSAANICYRSRCLLESAGHMMGGNPNHWMGILHPLPVNQLVLEVLDGEWTWVPIRNDAYSLPHLVVGPVATKQASEQDCWGGFGDPLLGGAAA